MMEIHTLGTSTTDKPLYSAKNNQNNQGEENHEGIKHFVFTCFSQTVVFKQLLEPKRATKVEDTFQQESQRGRTQ